jgi:MSHA biogenesis protein MshQ
VDVAVNLGSGTADQSCLSTHPSTTGASLSWLRSNFGNCASSFDRDPSARITFGVYSPESQRVIHVQDIH